MLKAINRKAWAIRRNAAKRFNCPVMEISWKVCLSTAKENSIAYLDLIVKRHTASKDFEDLLTVNENYNPTLYVCHPDKMILANAFDKYMEAFGKPNRVYRCNVSNKPNIETGFPSGMKARLAYEKEERRIERARVNYKQLIKEMQY